MDTTVTPDRPLEQLEAVIHQGAANLTAAEHDWLLAVAEFDRRQGWKLWECQSCAAWLCWQVGLDIRAAHEKVRVARALERFPVIAAAMATGQVSYSKVRAITRIATPECEQALVDMALAGTTNHVERIVSAYRRAEPIAVEREQIQHTRRSLIHRVDDDGSVVITIRLPAEAGATVLSAIEHLVAPSVAEPDGTRDPVSARRADALVDLAIAGNAASGKQGSATRYLAHLHLSQTALNGDDGRCEVHGHGDSLDQPNTAARFPAALAAATTRCTTSNTEPTKATASWRTSPCCAASTTTASTKAAGPPCAHPTDSSYTTPTGVGFARVHPSQAATAPQSQPTNASRPTVVANGAASDWTSATRSMLCTPAPTLPMECRSDKQQESSS